MGVDYYSVMIIVIVFQFFTFVALVVLWITIQELKNKILKFKDCIPLQNISTTAPGVSLPPRTQSNLAIGHRQNPEYDEIIEVVPTPNPIRRSCTAPTTTAHSGGPTLRAPMTTTIGRTMSSMSSETLSRDSGIGSSSGTNQSTSSELLNERTRHNSNPVFQDKISVREGSRTASNASCPSFSLRGVTSHLKPLPPIPRQTGNDDDDDDSGNHFQHSNRLQTMYIEDIDIRSGSMSNAEKRYKRASQLLNETVSFVNRGYSITDENTQSRAPLASEEGSNVSDVINLDENGNDVVEEVYENQVVVEQHRLSLRLDSCDE